MYYDEESALIDYVWDHGHPYMTELEKMGVKAVHARFKAKGASPAMAEKLLSKWGAVNDPEVNEALSHGVDAFRSAVATRVLRDNPEFVKRCPNCEKVLRTPAAKQCRWCFHEWHET